MSRGKLRPNMVFTTDTGLGYTIGASTITTGMLTPALGARIMQWGMTVTAVGVGNDTLTCSIKEEGSGANSATTRSAAQITIAGPDNLAVATQTTADGPALNDEGVPAAAQGERLQIDFAAAGGSDGFVTESATYTVWALWQL